MTSIVTGIVGLVLAAGTIIGVVASVHSSDRPSPASPLSNVQAYGGR